MRRAFSVQHGHTPVQQAIYSAMWSTAMKQPDGSRIIQIGYGHLAHRTGLHKSTICRNIRRLQSNYSIELVESANPAQAAGATYRVNSFRVILQRRREAHLDWISRPGHFRPGPTPAPNEHRNANVSLGRSSNGTIDIFEGHYSIN